MSPPLAQAARRHKSTQASLRGWHCRPFAPPRCTAMALRLVALAALGAAQATPAPVFDYTFGANCPFCKEFGTTLKKLNAADGIAAAVDFNLRAAIRGAAPAWDCPDEDDGCPMTKYVLCAFSAKKDKQDEVDFMTCWDESTASPASKAQSCAEQLKLDWAAISACAAGAEGAAREAAAALAFVTRFPEHKTGRFGVPHIYIGGVEQPNHDYQSLLSALCAAGAEAGACGGEVVQL
mmetsp:Transcript_49464/g.159715  ORF Transcript_49464/g.159715 Transcript_49464/m.159715 type:complete len:236 (+) Transcript_49464:40-747(+)|eukprot:CAMPEP_0203885092 /NCGR_PEP_ID=MMETSP0359-20131031/29092_1 /ASSEMBLY_ACC=CAM_ASM_000338 /TAXON_ID=268821 /ORGANISM="Scrippsiella Hangoei, Strain SHTV-5" /LENGTH=235 /DNA_ID=CAMNT_0050805667 /DNA_START=176 /DNA_END=883 /DNA_ORIENTATION=-